MKRPGRYATAIRFTLLRDACKGRLPLAFTVDPPYLVATVVRHVRGLHWGGEREYVISFARRPGPCPAVTLGSGPDADLCQPRRVRRRLLPALRRVRNRTRAWCGHGG